MEENIINLFKNNNDYCMIFNSIFENRRDLNYVKEVLNIIINKCLWHVLDYEDMLENLIWELDDDEIEIYMKKRYSDIIKNLNPNSLIFLKTNSDLEKNEVNKVLNSNYYKSIKEIVKHQCFENLNINSNEYDEEYLTHLILDILKNENKKVSDIQYEYGTFSNIYFIGDKVLKIGSRETYRIKNNKRYIKPVLRREYLFENKKQCIELTEKVSDDVNNKDLDMIIRELKSHGIYWLDPSVDNIGRLIKPNKVYYNHKLYSDNGYIETEDSKIVLPAGEVVILDNDHMFEEENGYVYVKK